MNEIDQILSNIDKDNDDRLFNENSAENKKNDEIVKLIDSLDMAPVAPGATETAAEPAPQQETAAPEHPGEPGPEETAAITELDRIGIFSVKGTKSWNRREPYLIRINADALKNDRESLKKSFYFVEEPSDQEAIRLRIKQEIVTFLRRPNEHISERYEVFIYKIITTAIGELSRSFKLNNANEKLFLYHTGPLTIYKFIRDNFSSKKYGYCYKYLPGNKASRFFPEEFIKEIVMKWFEENINTLDLPFDSIQKYEEMKKIVSFKYHENLRTFNARQEQLNEKLGPDRRISRVKLFQIKGYEWFGQMSIEIYRRFLGGSIFI
jgi:hypothetical protein